MGRNAGGRSGTLAPAARLVLLRGRERMAMQRKRDGVWKRILALPLCALRLRLKTL